MESGAPQIPVTQSAAPAPGSDAPAVPAAVVVPPLPLSTVAVASSSASIDAASPSKLLEPIALAEPHHATPSAVEKHAALMEMISGVHRADGVPFGAASLQPLPSYDDLLLEVSEKQALEPLAMPPIITSDISDCFRLYFGSSVTTFPFFASRLGVLGYLAVLSAAGVVTVITQLALHRTRYNLTLMEMNRRMQREKDSANASSTTTVELGSLGSRGNSVSNLHGLGESPAATPTASGQTTPRKTKKKKQKKPDDPSDMAPPFLKLCSLVKVCGALWSDHWMRHVVTAITCLSQFFSACSFVMLFGSNVGPVLGIGHTASIYLAAFLMGGLSLATMPVAKTIMAYFNNIFILGGACIILFYSFVHERTPEEDAMTLRIVPNSIADLAVYAPAIMSYMMSQLYSIDTETVVCIRAHRMLHGKDPEPSPESLATTPATSACSSMTTSPVTSNSPGKFPTAGNLSPSNSISLFTAAFSALRADTLRRSLIEVITIQKVFARSLNYGMVASVVVLGVCCSLIMANFKDNTNPIIALSLPDGTMRTTILILLSIGLYACGTLSVTPIAEMLDTLSASVTFEAFDLLIAKRIAARACLFAAALLFLHIVPFFDLVAALMGAACTPMIAFLIPTACELQSEVAKLAMRADTRAAVAAATPTDRLLMGWRALPLSGKGSAILSACLGSVIFIFSTMEVLKEIYRRQTA